MTVSKKDRDDYERGRKDRENDGPSQMVRDTLGLEKTSDAYYKGRRGEQLDADKKDDE